MKTARCLSCDSAIEIGSMVQIGQFVYCEFCGAEFEVLELNPVELEFAFGGDDLDYDDEDDYYSDYEDEESEGDDDYEESDEW